MDSTSESKFVSRLSHETMRDEPETCLTSHHPIRGETETTGGQRERKMGQVLQPHYYRTNPPRPTTSILAHGDDELARAIQDLLATGRPISAISAGLADDEWLIVASEPARTGTVGSPVVRAVPSPSASAGTKYFPGQCRPGLTKKDKNEIEE